MYPWNKGIKTGLVPKSAFKKGVHYNRATEFKKGEHPSKVTEFTREKMLGKKNPAWKGGISRAYKTGYYSKQYKEWRINVFERDKYACKKCGIMGNKAYLTAHHIKSFAHFPDLRYELSNGQTLCEDCHKLTDNYKGRNRMKVKI